MCNRWTHNSCFRSCLCPNHGRSTEQGRRCPHNTTCARPFRHRRTYMNRVRSAGIVNSSIHSIFGSASPQRARPAVVSRSSSRTFSYSTRLQAADFVKSPPLESEGSPRALSQVLESELLSRDVGVHYELLPYQTPTRALQSPGDRMRANPPKSTSIGTVSDVRAGGYSRSPRTLS